jgi:SWI/SNF-related matrix-associated actin-dependent regulator of chromatin subfamily A member 5
MDDRVSRLANLLEKAENYASMLFYGKHEKKVRPEGSSARKRLRREIEEEDSIIADQLETQPGMLRNGKLRDYQIDGVSWMSSLFHANINGILADEMGLGKTIQTIAFLAHLYERENVRGPHLIVVPKSTMGNWVNEFTKWCSSFRVVKLIAAKSSREDIIKNELQPGRFDVCVTSYEGVSLCQTALKKFRWEYFIIDEAHKIKNDESCLSLLIRKLHSNHRLLITGTPLQNNLHELWSLLNFLLPDLFDTSTDFEDLFNLGAQEGMTTAEVEDKNVELVQQLHTILKPFLLRRTKAEVERSIPPKKEIMVTVKMTPVQRDLYKKILTNELMRQDSKSQYLNIVIQLRKVCNHPYLFPGIEVEGQDDFGDHLIQHASKMKLLDKLLPRLKARQSQVLIFSQMTTMLDILEDYCTHRDFKYCRLDGSTDIYERESMIRKFTKANSKYFVFLLSTRAGGLGINLATADTVIIYDSDWNPQMDLQAMDRAHRIGQRKQVNVYRLITADSLEERIIERQCLRLKLDSLIIQQGRLAPRHKPLSKQELQDMLHYGADTIFKTTEDESDIKEDELEAILTRGDDRMNQLNREIDTQIDQKKMNLVDFESKIDMWQFESVDYSKKRKEESKSAIQDAISAKMYEEFKARRERKVQYNYNIDARFGNIMQITTKPKEFKAAPEYRFHDNRPRLLELQRKEFDKTASEEERVELEILLSTGFQWSRKEYQCFLKGSELYGKQDFQLISEIIGTKTPEEVERYAQVFWARIDELSDKERILKNIEKRENMAERHRHAQRLLDKKVSQYRVPIRDISFDVSGSHKSKIFTAENDRVLLCLAKTVGYGNWEELKVRTRLSPYTRFDYMLKSRTAGELQRRVDSLLRVLEKEEDEKHDGRPVREGIDEELPSKQRKMNDFYSSS